MGREHCGKVRDTPYCPECGADLSFGLRSLLKHLDTRVATLADSLLDWRGRPLNELRREEHIDRTSRLLERWQGWQLAVTRAIERT